MSDANDDKVGLGDCLSIAWKVTLISFLVLFFGGLALRAYSVLRFKDPATILEPDWLQGLVAFGACSALTFAALVVGWRLIHPKKSAPAWSMGVIAFLVLSFGFLVWPTPWTYREYGCKIIRINRFTGGRLEIATLPDCPASARKD